MKQTRAKMLMLAAVLAAVVFAAAESSAAGQRLRFEAKLGVNESSRYGDLAEMQWKTGLVGGIGVRFQRNTGPWIGVELFYSQKGANWSISEAESRLRLTYLELPVLLGASLRLGNATHFEPKVGLAPAYKTGETLTIHDSDFSSHYFNDWDLGAVFGAGIRRDMGRMGLTVDARYTLGLQDIDDSEETGFQGSDRNKSFSMLVGVMF